MRKHLISIFILSFLAVSVYCAQTEQEKREERPTTKTQKANLRSTNKVLEDNIVALERQVAEAIKRNDMDAFGSLLTDDYVQVDSAGATPKSVLVKNEGNFTIKDYTMEDIRVVELNQDTALLTSKFAQKGKYQGKDYSTHGYSSSVWVKRGGKWLCAFSQVTPANRLYAHR
jgi:hypothetical protein